MPKKATCGVGYKLTPTRNKDEAVIDKVDGIADARIKYPLVRKSLYAFKPTTRHIISTNFQ